MPKIEIGITDSDYIGTFKNQKRITFSAGSEKLSIRLSKNANSKTLQTSALKNPFEKFERKRFLYYSKDLNVISMNHALFIKMSKQDFEKVKVQMEEDLEKYYERVK